MTGLLSDLEEIEDHLLTQQEENLADGESRAEEESRAEDGLQAQGGMITEEDTEDLEGLQHIV